MTTDPTGTGAIPQEAVDAAADAWAAFYDEAIANGGRPGDSARAMAAALAAAAPFLLNRLTADLAAARQQLDAVRALHYDDMGEGWCSHCRLDCQCIEEPDGEICLVGDCCCPTRRPYPCPTALAVAPTDAPATKDGWGMSDGAMLHLRTRDSHNLNTACLAIVEAFDAHPYLVGSVLTRRDYRDVDVRLILHDHEFDILFHDRPRLWSFLCSTIGDSLAAQTGLPIDFQIQRMTEANEKHKGVRSALGLPSMYAAGGDAVPEWSR